MGITRRQLHGNIRQTTVNYNGQSFDLRYKVDTLTPNMLNEIGKSDTDEQLNESIDLLVELIIDWDIYEDEAETVRLPVSAEFFKEESVFFFNSVFKAVNESAQDVGKETQSSFGSTS